MDFRAMIALLSRKVVEFEKQQRTRAAEVSTERQRNKPTPEEKRQLKEEAWNEFQRERQENRREADHKHYGDLDDVLSDSEREKILSEEIKRRTGLGSKWRIDAKGPHWAQLVNPAGDTLGTGATVVAIFTLGLSLVFAPTRRGRNNDKTMYIEVLQNGIIETSGTLLAGKNYDHVPR